MIKKYSMRDTLDIADAAAKDIEQWLKTFEETIDVMNVENDEDYQLKDIDLLWIKQNRDGSKRTITIEVKGDRYYRTGNYFLETISNKKKNTPGCFMYTEADYVFYYFVDEKELHVLPMPRTRDWFIRNLHHFKERETSTPVGDGHYITVGRLVNRNELQKHVQGARVLKLP
ncbi:hypothetical protein DCC39_12585 [Pueribacillus theae]|uniref:DUF4365 domain-containing protein n=1 Tax=Pueribacillus theae TaxID=2171751 RepID=A0A2U1JWT4_9BACI|nr:hypothetical protein [Pueribacillus theae]PWA09676.1 hypothetical protein DCC39_12585 [Pueribacillus theae]